MRTVGLLVLGLEPAVIEMSSSLGPVVSDAMPRLLDAAVEELEGWGYKASKKSTSPDSSEYSAPTTRSFPSAQN